MVQLSCDIGRLISITARFPKANDRFYLNCENTLWYWLQQAMYFKWLLCALTTLCSTYGFVAKGLVGMVLKICLQGLAKVRNTNVLYLIIYNSLIQFTRNYIVGIGMHNELQKLNSGFYCCNGWFKGWRIKRLAIGLSLSIVMPLHPFVIYKYSLPSQYGLLLSYDARRKWYSCFCRLEGQREREICGTPSIKPVG